MWLKHDVNTYREQVAGGDGRAEGPMVTGTKKELAKRSMWLFAAQEG